MSGQLALDFDGAQRAEDNLREQVRQLVAEPGMSDREVEAVMKDALGEMGWHFNGELRAKPCRCPHPLLLADELAEQRCHWCGREPQTMNGDGSGAMLQRALR
jgi:hypothetical protein